MENGLKNNETEIAQTHIKMLKDLEREKDENYKKTNQYEQTIR